MTPAALRNPPFRAEHIGSLLRPSKLLEERHAIQAGKRLATNLHALEDESIREIVNVQTACGFHATTDGEYRRHLFWGTFFPSLDGFEELQNPDAEMFRDYFPGVPALVGPERVPGETFICTGKISHTGKSSYVEQFEFLKSITPVERHRGLKLTLAAPNWYHLWYVPSQSWTTYYGGQVY
jgi:methionine synthase II (cobalamin-independent)